MLLEDYIDAMVRAGSGSKAIGESSRLTQSMMADLINLPAERHGRGIMVLLRTINQADARMIKNGLVEARRRAGLTDRFSVILDIEGSLASHFRPRRTLKCTLSRRTKRMRWSGSLGSPRGAARVCC